MQSSCSNQQRVIEITKLLSMSQGLQVCLLTFVHSQSHLLPLKHVSRYTCLTCCTHLIECLHLANCFLEKLGLRGVLACVIVTIAS